MSTNTVTNSTLSAARKRDEMLEPYEWKRSRTVLRREGASNRPDLVDKIEFHTASFLFRHSIVSKYSAISRWLRKVLRIWES